MKIYFVIGAFGNGGMTTAMFNRAVMFKDAGYDCAILHTGYKPDFDNYISEVYAQGRLRSDIPVLNPYTELMKEAYLSDSVFKSDAVTAFAARSIGKGVAKYYSPDNRLLKTATFDDKLRLRALDTFFEGEGNFSRSEFSSYGWEERLSTFKNGVLLEERYFTPDMKTYLSRYMEAESGREKLIHLYDIRINGCQSFISNSKWHTAWFEHLAASYHGKSVFICDGPGNASRVININKGVAGRVVVLHSRHFDELEFRRGLPLREDAAFLRRIKEFDALVVLTEEQGHDISLDIGNKNKIFIIPNVVPSHPVPNVQRDPLRISTFGRLNFYKGTGDALKAFALVLKKQPGATLNIFGTGSELNSLQKLSKSLAISSSVKFHGYTHSPSIEMAKSAVVAFPSKREAWSLTVAESMLYETPVVAYNCKYGLKDVIEDGVDGYLVTPGDVAGLAERLIYALEHPKESQAMGHAGRKKILDLYTNEPLTKRWEQMFSKIL